jgi:hypothetical protein
MRNIRKTASTRYRPLGLLIAILATGVIYGIGPLIQPLMVFVINLRGGKVGDVNIDLLHTMDWLNAAIGLIVIAVCIMAWRGRPAWSRWVLITIVWIATLAQAISLLFPPVDDAAGNAIVGSNLSGVTQPLMACQLILYILIPLYITWYLNRAPARAFYHRES